MYKKALILILLIFPSTAVFSDMPVLSHEFWFFTESVPDFLSDDFPESKKDIRAETEENIREILKEAVHVFSGMIYGFRFSYTPGDARRGVAEIFDVQPAAQILPGDPALSARQNQSRRAGNRIYVLIDYMTDERHVNWLRYWGSSIFPLAGGSGEGVPEQGLEGKLDALREALKEAVREYLRPRVFNKPRLVEGEFVISEPPYYVYQAGRYTCSVKIKLNIDEVEGYRYY